jgi:hypothetical protein
MLKIKTTRGEQCTKVGSTISSPRLEQRSSLQSIDAVLREMLELPDNELAALYAESVLLRGGPTDEAKVAAVKQAGTHCDLIFHA